MDGETNEVMLPAMRLLRDVLSILARREEFLDTSGNGFNAFEAFRLSQEKFHSRMIGTLLSPESRHGLGTLFLQRFLETLGLAHFPIPEDNRGVFITTEKYIGEIEDGFECGGIIDILAESDGWSLAIENKINESERNNQPKQLYRYWNWVKSRRPNFALVYLTPSGKTAPAESTGGKLETDKDYIRLSYGKIADWIDLCIRDSARFPRIREVLVQYRDFLDQHVLPGRKEDKYMNEIEQLIKPGSFVAAEAIANALPNAKARAIEALLKAVLPSKVDPISTVEADFSNELRRFAEGLATDDNPCKLFSLKQPQTTDIMVLALAWDRESRQPGIGICCPNGGELGKILRCRFADKPWNKEATDFWPCWFRLDQVRFDAAFFDCVGEQSRFRTEFETKFDAVRDCFCKAAAELGPRESA